MENKENPSYASLIGQQSLRTDLEDIPLLDEGRHQQVDVVRLVEVVAHAVRQGADRVIPGAGRGHTKDTVLVLRLNVLPQNST